ARHHWHCRLPCGTAAGTARLPPVAGGRDDRQNVKRVCNMIVSRRDAVLLLTLAVVAGWSKTGPLYGTEAPMELQWHQLVPPVAPRPPKSFLAGRGPVDGGKLGGPDDGTSAPPPLPEGRWMSAPSRKETMPAPVVETRSGRGEPRRQARSYRRLCGTAQFRCHSGDRLPARTVRRCLHSRSTASSQSDYLRQDRAGVRCTRHLRSGVGHWYVEGRADFH